MDWEVAWLTRAVALHCREFFLSCIVQLFVSKSVIVFRFVFCLYAILLVRSPTGNCGVGLVHSKETLTNITWSHSESKVFQRVVNGSINCYCGNFELSSYLFSDYSQSSVEVRLEWKSCCFFCLMCYCYPFSNVCVYACVHGYVCKYVGIYVCMYVHIYVPMYICTYLCIHGCMDTFLLDVCSCRRWVWLRLLPPNLRQVCGDKSPPSLPRPSFLFHLLISVLNTSDGLGGNMTHSGCSSSL